MITNLWSVLCKDIVTDQKTNLVSYLNCLEGLTALKLPANLPLVSLGTLWLIEPENGKEVKFKVRLSFEKPGNSAKQLLVETPEKIYAKKHRERINFELSGLHIDMIGKYKFVIEYNDGVDWNIIGDVFLDVEIGENVKARV